MTHTLKGTPGKHSTLAPIGDLEGEGGGRLQPRGMDPGGGGGAPPCLFFVLTCLVMASPVLVAYGPCLQHPWMSLAFPITQ